MTNNSQILITDIGEGDSDALLCFTDLTQCCTDNDTASGSALGQWVFSNGSMVSMFADETDVYVDRGAGVVRLNVRPGGSLTGLICCMIPDASLVTQTTCTNISELGFSFVT